MNSVRGLPAIREWKGENAGKEKGKVTQCAKPWSFVEATQEAEEEEEPEEEEAEGRGERKV